MRKILLDIQYVVWYDQSILWVLSTVDQSMENGIISSYKKWNSKCDQNVSVDPIYVGTYFFSIYLEDLLAWLGPGPSQVRHASQSHDVTESNNKL